MTINRNGSLIGLIAIIIIVAVRSCVYFGFNGKEDEIIREEDIIVGGSVDPAQSTSSSGTTSRTFNIIITDNGYSPQSLTINIGDKVTWKNEGTACPRKRHQTGSP